MILFRHLRQGLPACVTAFAAIFAITLIIPIQVQAQDDLFGDAAFDPQDEGFDDAGFDDSGDDAGGDLFGVGDDVPAAPADPTAEGTDGDRSEPPIVDSAAVQAIRFRDPQTAEQLFLAIDQLIQLDRTDLAAEYLEKLQALNLDDVARTRLQRRFGTAALMRLARTGALAPQAGQFVRDVMDAVKRVTLDPARLENWANQLGEADRRTRFQAAVNLMNARGSAVEPIVAAIVRSSAEVDSSDPATQERATQQRRYGLAVLRQLGRDSVQPLIGQLSSPVADRRVVALQGLGQAGAREALPYLLGPAVAPRSGGTEFQAAHEAIRQITGQRATTGEATELLRREADRSYRGLSDESPNAGDLLVRWVWSQTSKQVRRQEMRSADAHALAASRLYRDLHRIQPYNEDVRTRYLISRLDVDQGVAGLDELLRRSVGSAFDQTRKAGTSVANRVLQQALRDGHVPAAIGATQVVAALEKDSLPGYQPSLARAATMGTETVSAPLVEALAADDARVRFAAARALVQLNPPAAFDGASRLAETLTHFASSINHPTAIVAHPRLVAASRYVGMLGNYGYAGLAVTNSRDLIRAAYRSPDLQLVLVSDAMNEISAWDAIEELRVHPNTANVPIVLLARPGREVAANRLADQQTDVTVWPEGMDDGGVLASLPRVIQPLNRSRISTEQRSRQAEAALGWLATWMSRSVQPAAGVDVNRWRGPSCVDWTRLEPQLATVFNQPATTLDGLTVFSRIGTLSAQTTLVETASETARPLEVRKAAGAAFQSSVERFGVLLSRAQILEQYDRYNASRVLDQDTQVLLGSVLDAIESRVHPDSEKVDVPEL